MGKAIESKQYGDCSLLIYGDYLCFDNIERELGLKATETVKKGQPLSRFGSSLLGFCKTSGWFYSIKYDENEGFLSALELLLSKFHPKRNELRMLVETVENIDVFIKISVISEYAQMFLEIEPKLQKLISELGFPLRVSILSFGMVEEQKLGRFSRRTPAITDRRFLRRRTKPIR